MIVRGRNECRLYDLGLSQDNEVERHVVMTFELNHDDLEFSGTGPVTARVRTFIDGIRQNTEAAELLVEVPFYRDDSTPTRIDFTGGGGPVISTGSIRRGVPQAMHLFHDPRDIVRWGLPAFSWQLALRI
ncbi:unnamed protein product [Chrysoparadoxa australica]